MSISCGVATLLVKPDGTRFNFAYDGVYSPINYPRLRLVTNSRGFGLGFNYLNPDVLTIGAVCAVNLTVSMPTVSAPCPAGSPTASYAYTGSNSFYLASYTNSANQTTSYTYNANPYGIATITNPGSAGPDLTNSYNSSSQKLTGQTYANGATWSYTYEQMVYDWETYPNNDWTNVTDPLGRTTRHEFVNSTGPGAPRIVTDPLNRTVQLQYHNGSARHLQRRTEPEGNYVHHSYDARRNVIETRRVSKTPGTPADIVTSASFPATCSNQKTCNRPTWTRDARQNQAPHVSDPNQQTDFIYDPNHGGLLTETGPAPTAGAPRPQRRLTYTQRYAWISNGAGGYVQAATPVWVVASESRCIAGAPHASGTGCANANDEVVTTYDYGPKFGAQQPAAARRDGDRSGTERREHAHLAHLLCLRHARQPDQRDRPRRQFGELPMSDRPRPVSNRSGDMAFRTS